MSIESAKAFVARMKNDQKFAAKIGECKNLAEFVSCAGKAGFHFTKEDFELVKSELSQEELSSVTGGMPPDPNCGDLHYDLEPHPGDPDYCYHTWSDSF
jgi:predicted ribosomally synthesized peptide with nif11-like leader